MAAGALGGWIADRIQSGRFNDAMARNNQSFSDRQSARTDWSLGNSPMGQFDAFGHGELTRDEGNIGSDLGITDWGSAEPESEDRPREKLKESRENDSRSFALQGVSNFLVNGSPVINGSRGYGAFGGSGQGYFKGRTPGK